MTFLGSNFGIDISARLKWALWWRVLFLGLLLVSSVAVDFFASGLVGAPLYWISGSGIAVSLLMLVGLEVVNKRSSLNILAGAQIIIDIAMITCLVVITGGLYSAFSSLYGLNIVLASVLLFSRGAIAASILSVLSLVFSCLFFNLQFNWDSASSIRLLLISSILLLVGGLISLLFRNREQLIQSLKEKSRDLRGLAELQSAIVENIPSGLLLLDDQQNVLYANSLARELLASSDQDLKLSQLSLPFEVIQKEVIEIDQVDSSGNKRTLRFHRVRLNSNECLLVFEDLTKVRELERSLYTKEKLEGIGKLATGLAHEIKNPLASLSGSIQLLNRELDLDESQRRLMQIVLRETDRLDDLLQSFLNYAKPATPRIERIELVSLVQEIVELFRNNEEMKSKNGRIELNTSGSSIDVECDASRIKQVFWNLIKNAVSAIAKNGTISISLTKKDARVLCEVSDNGEGMTDETKRRLFEPFYTSKEKGTGLGMATVYQILQLHHSDLLFESQLGEGTQFRFELGLEYKVHSDHKERAA